MKAQKVFKRLVIALVSLVLFITIFETLLRVSGKEPWSPVSHIDSPKAFQVDPMIGWKNKPGTYLFPKFTPDTIRATMNIDNEGFRITSPRPIKGAKTVVIAGGSYIMAWSVSDDQTFAWKIGERFKDLRVINMGSAGYSTYQSLLSIKDYLGSHGQKPDLVIYGFDYFQIERNVAVPTFANGLARFNREQRLGLPYCRLSSEPGRDLEYFRPEIYPDWPLKKYLALVNEAEFLYFRIKHKESYSQQHTVTELLLKEMAALCKSNNVALLIVTMIIPDQFGVKYLRFMEDQKIDCISCSVDYFKTRDFVPGDLHPNEKVHDRWAECIGDAIEERLYQKSTKDKS